MSEPRERPPSTLNQSCFCTTVDRDGLLQALEREISDDNLARAIATTHPHLFASVSVFLAGTDLTRMRNVVRAIESIAELPAYRQAVLSWAPAIAQNDHGPAGALMGYDFHVGDGAPQLIEINTNAGGAFLNAFLARAQTTCCPEARRREIETATGFEAAIEGMFRSEWRRQCGDAPLASIAIVDDAPREQYLYPEFLLAQRLLTQAGLEAVVVDPKELSYQDGRLVVAGKTIDLIYNRLTDFAFAHPDHTALRDAYCDGAAVVTPNPHIHALLADKRNLTLLSDRTTLASWGVEEPAIDILEASIPRTVCVTADNAADIWKNRRQLFFKPMTGFGSKGAYRGDKITKGVWESIVSGDYVAQSFAAPGQRKVKLDGAEVSLKADIRLYTYAGRDLMIAARLYQGQTTNLRTQGGGFAPVFLT